MVLFEIMGIRKLDEGVYTCVATNKAGQDETSFNLKYIEGVDKDIPKFTSQLKVSDHHMNTQKPLISITIIGCYESQRWNVSTF